MDPIALHSSIRVGESQVNFLKRQAGWAVGLDPDGQIVGSPTDPAGGQFPIHPGCAAGIWPSNAVSGGKPNPVDLKGGLIRPDRRRPSNTQFRLRA